VLKATIVRQKKRNEIIVMHAAGQLFLTGQSECRERPSFVKKKRGAQQVDRVETATQV
jgi:hypothetical protein